MFSGSPSVSSHRHVRVRQQPVPGLQQFFKWLAAEEEVLDPMAGLKPPESPASPSRSSPQGTGMRLSELAGIRYNPDDPRRSDLHLWHREITVHGKGRKTLCLWSLAPRSAPQDLVSKANVRKPGPGAIADRESGHDLTRMSDPAPAAGDSLD